MALNINLTDLRLNDRTVREIRPEWQWPKVDPLFCRPSFQVSSPTWLRDSSVFLPRLPDTSTHSSRDFIDSSLADVTAFSSFFPNIATPRLSESHSLGQNISVILTTKAYFLNILRFLVILIRHNAEDSLMAYVTAFFCLFAEHRNDVTHRLVRHPFCRKLRGRFL